MHKIDITEFFIYRYRYALGYGLIGLLLIGLLFFAALYVPNSLSKTEINSVITSDSLSLKSLNQAVIINLPYHLLQKISLALFGISNLTIKLPSIILGLLSTVGLFFLLRNWFKRGIAVLVSIIATITGQFLLFAQSGSPSILYLFWPIVMLLLVTLIANRHRLNILWKTLFFIAAALSLYTPLSIYILITFISAILLHPHLRYLIRQLSKLKLLVALVIAILIVLPLGWRIVQEPRFGLTLLGIPGQWPDFKANLVQLVQEFFGFTLSSSTNLIIPVFGLASMILIALGVYKVIRTRKTVQSYLIMTWLLCLLPILIINPTYTGITFAPLVLLLAIGFETLLHNWYRLFPYNPYARVAGLIPLIVLLSVLVISGIDRYVYGYYYNPSVVNGFSKDLVLLPKNTRHIVVSKTELPFYSVIAKHRSELEVSTTVPLLVDRFTMTKAAHSQLTSDYAIDKIISSAKQKNADRFYIYKKSQD
jgi:4-amino-4-deoxy-L-arabinose transferase-like glycosyltransferase